MATAQLDAVLRHIRRLAASQQTRERTDRQLLQDFLTSHDQAAFAALVRRHGPMVLRVCRHVLRHEHDSEDAFQATFLVLVRSASSVRRQEALASWLHGVAYRVAMKAKRDTVRRRVHEREARAMSPTSFSGQVDWREVQAVLDEEIQRLPEKYRSPFVLCFLEGRSRAETARELGLKEGTVWSRLSQARKQLRERLSRRGVCLSIVLGATGLVEGTAMAVPPSLVASTAEAASLYTSGKAAAGGAISAKAITLAEKVSKTMFLTKLKTGIVLCLLAAGLVATGGSVMMRGVVGAVPPAPQQNESPKQALGPQKQRIEAAVQEFGDTIAVRGHVLDPDGKPLTGAEITLWWHLGYWGYYQAWHPRGTNLFKPKPTTTSGNDGSFDFKFKKAEIDENPLSMWDPPWRHILVVAAAKGYGPAWASYLEDRELTLRLAKDDVPIKGRVVDLQGRPVAGVRVWVERVTVGGDEFRSLWQPTWAGLSQNVTTAKDGRFAMTGIGRDRTVVLHIEGPTIEHKIISVSTQAVVDGQSVPSSSIEVIAGPTKPIEGTIRDKDSGKPLAGVVVYGGDESNIGIGHETYHRGVRAVTDKQGRYRLLGLPKKGTYVLTVYPPADQGYVWTVKHIGDTEGLRPITADIELRCGVQVRCRLIDKETRQPVRGVLHYTPMKTNPYYSEAEQAPGLIPTREFYRIHVPDPDGVFHLVAYPGPGFLLANLQGNALKFLPAQLTASDREKAQGDLQLDFAGLGWPYRLIDAKESDKPLTLDIELDPGRKVKGSLIGPDGKPIAGVAAYGLSYHPAHERNHMNLNQQLEAEFFTATLLDREKPRTVSFVHKDRKLAGYAILRGDEKGQVVVRLQAWGTLTGRLIDGEGKPVSGIRLAWHYPSLPAPGMRSPDQAITTDAEGRFRVEGLLPGPQFELRLVGEKAKEVTLSAGEALNKLSTHAGETKDLGDIKVQVIPGKKTRREGRNEQPYQANRQG